MIQKLKIIVIYQEKIEDQLIIFVILYVKQKESNFIPFLFHNFNNYDCHLFFKTLIDKKPYNIKLKIIPKTNEEYICQLIMDV